ncbi:MAG TPA: MBOAT family O-acyltransferase, partial [Pirellulales bacterium]
MLFNSYEFMLVFLPVCLLVFAVLVKFRSTTPALAWLTFASFAFYGYWTPLYLPLFAGSILGNHLLSSAIVKSDEGSRRKKVLLTLGVVLNLGLLAYFKYVGFFLDVIGVGRGVLGDVILPLGISFYTFHQLAYLIGVYYDGKKHCGLMDYSFYVAFFPQLIAGPITRPHEVLPQIKERGRLGLNEESFAVGLTIFAMGLVKKVMFADAVAKYANMAFDASAAGDSVPMLAAWLGMFAYTMQLYFDFSGYSDMAIGLARMFGIRLPLNFNA